MEVECEEGASLIGGELQITCDTGSQWEYGKSGPPICMPGNENISFRPQIRKTVEFGVKLTSYFENRGKYQNSVQ